MSKILSKPKTGSFSDTAVAQYPLNYVNDRFIVSLNYNANIGYSKTGLYNWQFSDKGTDGNKYLTNKAIYCKGSYIIPCRAMLSGQVPRQTNVYFYSDDGVAWVQKELPTLSRYMGATNGEEFILVGSLQTADSIVIYQSTDGLNWTDITSKATFTDTSGYPVDIVYNNKDGSYCILLTDAKARTDVLTLCCGNADGFATVEVSTQLNNAVTSSGTLLMAGDSIIYYDTAYPYIYRADATETFLTSEWEQIELEYESGAIAKEVHAGYSTGFLLVGFSQTKTVGTGGVKSENLIYIEDGTLTQNVILNKDQAIGTIQAIAGNDTRFVVSTDTTKIYAIDIVEETESTPHRLFRYQDIQNIDRATWVDYIAKMQSGDFAGAQTAIKDITDKQLTATQLNDLFNFIMEMQNVSDPTFKSDVIKMSATVPAGLVVGKMYFKEYV